MGFNEIKFKNLESVKEVNKLKPFKPKGHLKKLWYSGESDDDDKDSEDEWKNKDFFESSIFWQHQ